MPKTFVKFSKPLEINIAEVAKHLSEYKYTSSMKDSFDEFRGKRKCLLTFYAREQNGFTGVSSDYDPESLAVLLKKLPFDIILPLKTALIGTKLEIPEIKDGFIPDFPIISLPEINPDKKFFGRKKLLEHLAREFDAHQLSQSGDSKTIKLSAVAGSPKVILCAGLGGIGKSELALQYAHIANTKHKLWFPAHNKKILIESYRTFITDYLDDDLENSDAKMIARVHSWFSDHSNYLVIYDGIENYEDIIACIPMIGSGNILLTSRLLPPNNCLASIPVLTVPVDVLLPDEASSLIDSILHVYDPDISKLAERMSYFPLSLVLAAGYVLENSISIKEYLSMYTEKPRYCLEQSEFPPMFKPADSILNTLKKSLALLSQQVTSPSKLESCRKLLEFCTYTKSKSISYALLHTWKQYTYPIAQESLKEMLQSLVDCSLIFLNNDDFSIQVNPLLKEIIKLENSPKQEKEALSLIEKLPSYSALQLHIAKEDKSHSVETIGDGKAIQRALLYIFKPKKQNISREAQMQLMHTVAKVFKR